MFSSSRKFKKGFSLLELMVVLAIFAVMTGILIADIPNFREKSSLDLTMSEVATYVRGAQVYGSSQKGSGTGTVFYRIHFDKGSPTFYLYKSLIGSGAPEETYKLNGFKINNILVHTSSPSSPSSFVCPTSFDVAYTSNTYTQNIGTALEALFQVPFGFNIVGYDYADIMVRGIKNPTNEGCLRIYQNGQITNVDCKSSDSFNSGRCPS